MACKEKKLKLMKTYQTFLKLSSYPKQNRLLLKKKTCKLILVSKFKIQTQLMNLKRFSSLNIKCKALHGIVCFKIQSIQMSLITLEHMLAKEKSLLKMVEKKILMMTVTWFLNKLLLDVNKVILLQFFLTQLLSQIQL